MSKVRLAETASRILYWRTDDQEDKAEWGELAEALLEVSLDLPATIRQRVQSRVANFITRRDLLESQIRTAECCENGD